jgi:hypothetical protein
VKFVLAYFNYTRKFLIFLNGKRQFQGNTEVYIRTNKDAKLFNFDCPLDWGNRFLRNVSIYRPTHCHIPENCKFRIYRCDNLRSHTVREQSQWIEPFTITVLCRLQYGGPDIFPPDSFFENQNCRKRWNVPIINPLSWILLVDPTPDIYQKVLSLLGGSILKPSSSWSSWISSSNRLII